MTSRNAGSLSARLDYIFLQQYAVYDRNLFDAAMIFQDPIDISGTMQWLSDHVGVYAELEIKRRFPERVSVSLDQ